MCDRWDSQRSLLSYMTVGIPTVTFKLYDRWNPNSHIPDRKKIHGKRERYI